jgi:hypothetical protein
VTLDVAFGRFDVFWMTLVTLALKLVIFAEAALAPVSVAYSAPAATAFASITRLNCARP